MAVTFALRGDSIDARYSSSGKSPYLIHRNGDTAPAPVADATSGVFGSSKISFSSGTTNEAKHLVYPARKNFSQTNKFSILMRIVPEFTSGAIGKEQPILFSGWPQVSSFGSYLSVYINTNSTILFTLSDRKNSATSGGQFTSSAFSFTSGVPTDIMIVWDETSNPRLKFSQDGVEISTHGTTGDSFEDTWALWGEIHLGYVAGANDGAGQNLTAINELVIYDTAESHTYAARTGFVSTSVFDGSITSEPGIANVKTGVAYTIEGNALTGTYDGSDRWTDPGVANVRLATAYKANSTSNNRTGTVTIPATGDVKTGVTFDASLGSTGTYEGTDRYTDPGIANVTLGTVYKFNSTSNNRTGTSVKTVIDSDFTADVVTVGADSLTITRGDGPVTIRATAKSNAVAQSIVGATFQTFFPKQGGGSVIVLNGSHSIVESGGSNTGVFDITLTAAQTRLLKAGKSLRGYTAITIGGTTLRYWFSVKEVRIGPLG
jgi:hypothetical protein